MPETDEAIEENTEKNQDQQNGDTQLDSQADVQSVEFSEVAEAEDVSTGGSVKILLNMGILVTVSIGQTEIPVRQLLQLGPGSVLKLDKSIDAPADLYLRDTKFATGNIVVVDGRFAVRLKQILGLDESDIEAAQV